MTQPTWMSVMPTANRRATGTARRVLAGCPQPLRDERDAHDDVAGHHRREVLRH